MHNDPLDACKGGHTQVGHVSGICAHASSLHPSWPEGAPRDYLATEFTPPRHFLSRSDTPGVSTLFVDAAHGDDRNDGSEKNPLKTIARALEKARLAPAPRTIYLSSGLPHRLTSTMAMDTGLSNTTITTWPDDAGNISGHDASDGTSALAIVSGGVEWQPEWKPAPKGKFSTSDGSVVYSATVTLPQGVGEVRG